MLKREVKDMRLKTIKSLSAMAFFGCACGVSFAGAFDKEIAEVKAGTRTVAKASWWGFDKEDSTKALQSAIDSGVKKLIVDNTGSDWVVEPIKLASDQEIVFEKDVVVIAKKNAFKKLNDCLLSATGKKNIVLRGEEGATLKMRKADYHDATNYKLGEWRHAIALHSVENVTIKNLTTLSSGGDGIYVGCRQGGNSMNFSRNILIDGVVCDDHNRQGISVISAENLTIKNSVFKNTRGTAPEAGIDFEPNNANERLVNCVVENCSFTGNAGSGIDIYLVGDVPLSISVRNSKIYGNNRGIKYSIAPKRSGISGSVEFAGCSIGDSAGRNIDIRCAGASFRFKNCTVDNTASKSTAITVTEKADHQAESLLEFDNFNVIDDAPGRLPLSITSFLRSPKVNVKGSINFTHPGMTSSLIDCSGKLAPAYEEEFTEAAPIDATKLAGSKAVASAPAGVRESAIPIRQQVKFVLLAEQGRKLEFEVKGVKVGKNDKPVAMRVNSPKGVEAMKFDLPPTASWKEEEKGAWRKLELLPEESGFYTIECVENHGNAFMIRSATPGGYLVENEFHMICPKGRLFFQVPEGVKNVKIEIFGDSNEPVSASLIDPKGVAVNSQADAETPKLLSFKRAGGLNAEIWAIEFKNAVEDCYFRMGEGLLPVVSDKAENLPTLR